MVARARVKTESFEDYRTNLKQEARVLKQRIKGKWVWKTFFDLTPDQARGIMGAGGVLWERDPVSGTMVRSTVFDPKAHLYYYKMEPYKKETK